MYHVSKKLTIVCYMLYVSCFVALDQITKAIFAPRDFFVSVIHFHLVKNYGLSFGLNFGTVINSLIIAAAFIIFILFLRKQSGTLKLNWSLLYILAGAASNLFDRLYFGYVRDFIDVSLGFTFNLADLFIILGLCMLFIANNQDQAAQ